MQLTPDQEAATDKFFNFLMSDRKEFILAGGAGVGKTFIAGYLVDKIIPRYRASCNLLGVKEDFVEAVFTATTNKAAEILEKSINRPVSTIHSCLGLKITDNHNTGKSDINATGRHSLPAGTILFIDESSMISTELLAYIRELTHQCKIVYIGDHAQMAPVGEVISPIYSEVDEDTFVFLDKPVRNAGAPALVALCAQLRETVETGVFWPMEPVKGVIEYLDDQQMADKLTEHLLKPDGTCRVLAYTNPRVHQINSYLRQERGLPEHYIPGETLVVGTTYAKGKVTLNVERQVHVEWVDSNVSEVRFSGDLLIRYRKMRITSAFAGVNAIEVNVATEPLVLSQALKTLRARKDWSSFFALKAYCIDLRPMDACTVYKSQGSTYKTVFIDIGNIGESLDAAQVARMLFVAVSRATTCVYFYGRLPAIYEGRTPWKNVQSRSA